MAITARRSICWVIACAAAGLLCSGLACVPPPPQRLNAPPQGDFLNQPPMAAYYGYHNDQGMVADLSIADLHFVPHSAELSGTGEARLERYAELLAGSGGTIHYETALQDEALLDGRLATAEAFLAHAVPGPKKIEVVVGLPGGRGMSAKESSGGKAVAQQAEERKKAYRLKGGGL